MKLNDLFTKVKLNRLKDNRCMNCGKKLAKYKINNKWDKYSYYHNCGCISKDIISSSI